MQSGYTDQAQSFDIIARKGSDFNLVVTINPQDSGFDIDDYDFSFLLKDRISGSTVLLANDLSVSGDEITVFIPGSAMDMEAKSYLYEIFAVGDESKIVFLASKFEVTASAASANDALKYSLLLGTSFLKYLQGLEGYGPAKIIKSGQDGIEWVEAQEAGDGLTAEDVNGLIDTALEPVNENISSLSDRVEALEEGGGSGGSDTFPADFVVSLSGGKNYLKWQSGQTVPAAGKTAVALMQEGAQEAIAPSLTLSSPTSIAFNQTAISNVLNFSKTINSLGASIATLSLEWRRNNSGAWTTLTSNTALITYTHSLTDTANNTQPFNYRLTVADSAGGTATVTADIAPANYQSPSIASPAASETRELGNISTALSSLITRNSPNVPLVSYKFQYQINGAGSWIDVPSGGGSLSGASQTVSVTHNEASLINSTSIVYRTAVTDAQGTTYSSTPVISFVYKSFLGYDNDTTVTLTELLAFGNGSLTNGKGRTVSGVTASGGAYTFYAYNAGAGDISSIQSGPEDIYTEALGGAFTKLSDVSGVNSFGASVTYRIYKSNSTNAFTGATLTFN